MLCKNPYVRKAGSGIVTVLDPETRGQYAPFGCGQCLPCRINKQREHRAKIILEANTHKKNCFYTMTYHPDHMPEDGKISVDVMQKFVKRLRKHEEFRYFIVGEYGSLSGRPHYHAMLFGLGREDKPAMDKAWPFGHTMAGDINSSTAHYVTDYALKGRDYENHDPNDPETVKIQSTKPALGSAFIDKLADQIVTSGMVPPDIRYFQLGKHKYYLGRTLYERMVEKNSEMRKSQSSSNLKMLQRECVKQMSYRLLIDRTRFYREKLKGQFKSAVITTLKRGGHYKDYFYYAEESLLPIVRLLNQEKIRRKNEEIKNFIKPLSFDDLRPWKARSPNMDRGIARRHVPTRYVSSG